MPPEELRAGRQSSGLNTTSRLNWAMNQGRGEEGERERERERTKETKREPREHEHVAGMAGLYRTQRLGQPGCQRGLGSRFLAVLREAGGWHALWYANRQHSYHLSQVSPDLTGRCCLQ